jgi:DNA invertase Pin-like site-specific DNA recombinase
MTGQRIGYVRVITFDQNPDRQLEPIDEDRIFTDKASGRDVHRPQLKALLDFVREGDTLVVYSMDRLARDFGISRETLYKYLRMKGPIPTFVTPEAITPRQPRQSLFACSYPRKIHHMD